MSDLAFPLNSEDYRAPAELGGVGGRALVIGGVAAAATVLGFFVDSGHFYASYLVAWLLWFSVAAGCLGLLMLHHLSGGAWGIVVRRQLEAGARTVPIMGLFSIPLFFGLGHLFTWTNTAKVMADPTLRHKEIYLNPGFFVFRTVFAILLFTFFAYFLSRKSASQDAEGERGQRMTMMRWSSIGLLLFVIVSSFLAFDWLMSLDAYWFSSMFGGIFVAGEGLSGMAVTILFATYLVQRQPMDRILSKRNFHDYGKLLFAMVMFITYLAISEFIIVYQGNLPDEVEWFNHRFHGGWGYVAWGVLLFHFFFPFFILLSRDIKKKPKLLASIAAFVLLMRWLHLYWLSRPSLTTRAYGLSWLDLAAPIALGGIWAYFFIRELNRRPLLPVNDPSLAEALAND